MIGEICQIKDCKNILKIKDGRICHTHRTRWYRHKDYNYISPNWANLKKGKPNLSPLGYFRININGKRILHHRYIMEQFLKRKLKKDERVHHLNHIKTDNRIENLELCKNNGEHISKHHPDIWTKRKKNNTSIDWFKYNVPKKNTKGACLINNCNIKTRSRGLCTKHYTSFYKNWLH